MKQQKEEKAWFDSWPRIIEAAAGFVNTGSKRPLNHLRYLLIYVIVGAINRSWNRPCPPFETRSLQVEGRPFMNIAAIVANAAQLVIILAIFFLRGLELGALVIFLLFLLMPIPFINFLAIFFSNRPIGGSSVDKDEDQAMIKREAMRVVYNNDQCPILKTSGTSFAVRDLSEGGVRISASSAIPFKKKVSGEIQLISGDCFRFKASLMRRENGEVVFLFSDPIGTAVIMQEKKIQAADTSG